MRYRQAYRCIYQKPYGDGSLFAFGANISNIGNKISYTTTGPSYFLPANLKLGVANTWSLDDLSKFTVAFDVNKLLVPTPPYPRQRRQHNTG
jgi:hypothetical protein